MWLKPTTSHYTNTSVIVRMSLANFTLQIGLRFINYNLTRASITTHFVFLQLFEWLPLPVYVSHRHHRL